MCGTLYVGETMDETNTYQMDNESTRTWLHRMVDEIFDNEGTRIGVSLDIVEDTDPRLMQLHLEWFDIAQQKMLREEVNH